MILIIYCKKAFNHQKKFPDLGSNLEHSGRGIPLVSSLCKSFTFKGEGNLVVAVFDVFYL